MTPRTPLLPRTNDTSLEGVAPLPVWRTITRTLDRIADPVYVAAVAAFVADALEVSLWFDTVAHPMAALRDLAGRDE